MAANILGFRGEFAFLSNFFESNIIYEGICYPTVEHAFQAAKSTDDTERQKIADCGNPSQAKKLGRRVQLRVDWEQVKLGIMRELLILKFANPVLREKLLATGKLEIIELNNWGDCYWGAIQLKSGQRVGENHLGKLLTEIRAEILG